MPNSPAPAQRHRLYEDLQALLTGTLLVAIGLALFRQAGLMTGGTVGLAFLLHYASGWPFGWLFFAINLPFYLLALLSSWLPQWLRFEAVAPLFAALAGGLLLGVGFVILFRHRASLGGLNLLVLLLQERFGWRAGWLQLGLDGAILLAAWPWLDLQRLLLSMLAAAAMNTALAVNHRPGRYMAF